MGANVLNIFCFYDCVLQNKSDYLSVRKMDGPHFVILDWGVGDGRASVCGIDFFFHFFFLTFLSCIFGRAIACVRRVSRKHWLDSLTQIVFSHFWSVGIFWKLLNSTPTPPTQKRNGLSFSRWFYLHTRLFFVSFRDYP